MRLSDQPDPADDQDMDLTLGRKFSGQPKGGSGKKSPAELKRVTHCATCGQLGHWQGDQECPGVLPGQAKGAAKGNRPNAKAQVGQGKGAPPKSTHNVNAVVTRDAGSLQISDGVNNGTMFTVNTVFSNSQQLSAAPFDHYMIGPVQANLGVTRFVVPSWTTISPPTSFRFATCSCFYLPVGIGSQADFLLDATISLLASHETLRSLGAIIDLTGSKVTFCKINVEVGCWHSLMDGVTAGGSAIMRSLGNTRVRTALTMW